MNEPKDDLLAAFENPDMAVPEMPQEEAVSNTVPEAPVAPAPEVPVTPVEPVAPAPEIPVTPVAPEVPVQNVVPQAPVGPAPVQNVAPTPVEPVAQETPVMEENQNAMPNVSVEPAVEVNRDVKAEEPKAEGSSLKKNLAFIIIICALIAVFIFFLPTIMSFISGGSY